MNGVKRTGIRDVAKAAGVSITTVSKALNGYSDVNPETKKRIQETAKRLNYVPDVNARSLGGISKKTLAFLVSGLVEKDESGFVYGLISGMYQASMEHNFNFIILTTNAALQSEMSYIQLCRQQNIDGVLVSGLNNNEPYYKELMSSEIPCVVVEGEYKSRNVCGISIDNARAAYDAVHYLIGEGHHKIVMMNGKETATVSQRRKKGYLQAMAEAGLETDELWIENGEFDEQVAYEKTFRLLENCPGLSAVFCASDLMAVGVIQALNEKGLSVPEDVSVIGFDDIPTAKYINGGLTTISQSPYEIGKSGGSVLYHMISEGREYSHVYVDYRFIKRATTSPCKTYHNNIEIDC